MSLQRFRALSDHDRILVAIAVLLDGHEASVYLQSDTFGGDALSRAAQELAGLDPEVRMPLLGKLLRTAVEQGAD